MQFKKYSQRVGEMMHVEMRACPLKALTFSTTLQNEASAGTNAGAGIRFHRL